MASLSSLRRLRDPGRGPADSFEPARSELGEAALRLSFECDAGFVGDHDHSGRGNRDKAAGQVHGGTEEVALCGEHRAIGHSDACVRQELLVGVRVGERRRNTEADVDVLTHDHDAVTEGLDDAPSTRCHQVEGDGLEPAHERGELVVLQLFTQGRKPDEIGEDHRYGLRGGTRRGLGARDNLSGELCQELTPEEVVEQSRDLD